ncbi:LysE family transporter [Tenuibacillus multivorans]|uniref:Threonine/homoserine/homoserine lactone efflux protein n=1 Tax=Tenuibacillus multivorans TaxID=237069 RepID=A0A1G9WBG6_9BACI|nr:LysE family transporter [Tenuibacillus multivorans]GEL76376.1 amino acid transporter [Tenuibacillus multivorans]SDM81556.1 Threonine/homoserine/homoserine lactone efflux protein [Tenuibacillus multivorans]
MGVFFSYLLLGISLAAPIGPVNAAQLDRGIKGGFFPAWFVGLGAITADVIYMLMVYLGVVHVVDTPFVKTFLWLFGGFILIYTGIESMLSAKEIKVIHERNTEPLHKSFLTGFIMSISNPLTILFWLGIYGSVLAQTASSYGYQSLILYSCAIFIGLLTWDVSMAAVSSSFRKILNDRILTGIAVMSGLALIGFGLYFGWQGILLLIQH